MAYKWKPSASAKRAFAERMKNPNEAAEYEQRKADRAANRRKNSQFDYNSAGGKYIPTKFQYDVAINILTMADNPTEEQINAANMVTFGYSNNDKIHHDFIHIVNEYQRTQKMI